MIEAKELRIGNIVKYPNYNRDGSDEIFAIRDIYTDDNRISLTNGIYQLPCSKLDYIQPIPLTEEWLERFGFTYEGVGNKWLTIFTPCGKALVYYDKFSFKFVGVNIETPIEQVHQLQNLYFALTGEELKLKQ